MLPDWAPRWMTAVLLLWRFAEDIGWAYFILCLYFWPKRLLGIGKFFVTLYAWRTLYPPPGVRLSCRSRRSHRR